jgi:hypothetical protein
MISTVTFGRAKEVNDWMAISTETGLTNCNAQILCSRLATNTTDVGLTSIVVAVKNGDSDR